MKNKTKKAIKKSFLYPYLRKVKNYKALKEESNYDYFLTSVVSGKILIKIENIPGTYFVNLRSDICKRVLITKNYEPEIVNLILGNIPKKGDVINIGANIGLFANLAAQNLHSKNRVMAVEPTKNAFELLEKNILNNNNQNIITTFKGIITDKKDKYLINTIEGKEEYSSVGNIVHEAVAKETTLEEEVEGISMDELIRHHHLTPKLLIIDVEGAEYKVFKGGLDVLKKYKPIIISELDDDLLKMQNSSAKEVIKLLDRIGYNISDVDGSEIDYPFSGNILAKPIR